MATPLKRPLIRNHAFNGFVRGVRIRGASRGRLRELITEENNGSTGAPGAGMPLDANSASEPPSLTQLGRDDGSLQPKLPQISISIRLLLVFILL